MANGTCLSCCADLSPSARRRVPTFIECCYRCWNKVPIADRLRLSIAVRDRTAGGVLNELADVLTRTIQLQQTGERDD